MKPEPFPAKCPHCGKSQIFPPEYAGVETQCTGCGKPHSLPSESEIETVRKQQMMASKLAAFRSRPCIIIAIVTIVLAVLVFIFPPFQNDSLTNLDSNPRNTGIIFSPPSNELPDHLRGQRGNVQIMNQDGSFDSQVKIANGRLASEWKLDSERLLFEIAAIIGFGIAVYLITFLIVARKP